MKMLTDSGPDDGQKVITFAHPEHSSGELTMLTLKTPRKPASENVVCLCRLLNILANF